MSWVGRLGGLRLVHRRRMGAGDAAGLERTSDADADAGDFSRSLAQGSLFR